MAMEGVQVGQGGLRQSGHREGRELWGACPGQSDPALRGAD